MARIPKSEGPEQVTHFVEDLAIVGEQCGWPSIAGKILGWLLVCEVPDQEAEQIAEALQASRASVSTMTRFLIDRGLVERRTIAGDKRVRYRVRSGVWVSLIRDRLQGLGALRWLAERGQAALRDRPPAQRARVDEMVAFYTWWERELPALFERWEQLQAGVPERPRRRG